MTRTRTLTWFLVIIILLTLLIGCNKQPNGQSDLSQPTTIIGVPSRSDEPFFRFEEVEMFQKWPLPTSLIAEIEAKKLTYDQLWGIIFDWVPKADRYFGEAMPLHRTPDDGKYYPNRFYIHPDFDKILGKGPPRDKIGVFFVKNFDEDLVNALTSEPIALDDKLAGFYIDCKTVYANIDQPAFRLSVESEFYTTSGKGISIVENDFIEHGVDGWAYLPQP